jgi:hypothetical protein
MRVTPTFVWLAALLGVFVLQPGSASAKTKSKDPCSKADALLARTGQGDTDADGLSDCRETRTLRTFPNDRDSDDDGMDDGAEIPKACDPLDPDSDDDGIDDGDDSSPAVEQKLEALLDAIVCPVADVPGSISALGISAVLNAQTEFEHASCADLASLLAGGSSVLVDVEILEDVLGALTATEVELEKPRHNHDHDDED